MPQKTGQTEIEIIKIERKEVSTLGPTGGKTERWTSFRDSAWMEEENWEG